MIDVSVSGVSKYFGSDVIFDKISFDIYEGQHVALIGRNGAGKTTLIRILTGELLPDCGTVSFPQGGKISMTSQIPVYPEEYTVNDVLNTAFSRLHSMRDEMKAMEKELAVSQEASLVKRYGELSASFEAFGGYDMDVRLRKVANGLRLSEEFCAKGFDVLSGGEKTRVNLARIILEEPDIILLDEPTNHLDIESCEWLADFINNYKKTVLIVSHDRYFLDQTVDIIFELENKKIERYIGNYSQYAVMKQQRIEKAENDYKRYEEEVKRLEDAAAKLHARGTQSEKMHKSAFAIEKRIERMTVYERPHREKRVNASFKAEELGTEELFKLKNVSCELDGRRILSDMTFEIKNGDRVAIIGRNGAGKTTLLKVMMANIRKSSGGIFVAPSVRYAYLPQIVIFPNESRNLIDTLIYEKRLSVQEARNRLGAFGFSGEAQQKPISVLSGGEKSRLYLCMVMADKINTLILDEPTNHLDIPSREWIEDAVDGFDGTIIFVSHDRYFISRFANKILTLENGRACMFEGDYRRYCELKERNKSLGDDCRTEGKRSLNIQKSREENNKKEKRSRGINDKMTAKRIAVLEREIQNAEKKLEEINAQMEINCADAGKLMELSEQAAKTEDEINELYKKWQNEIETAESN